MLLLGKNLAARLSPSGTVFAASVCRLLSSTPPTREEEEAPSGSPTTSDFAIQYLVNSCGLPSDRAIRAAKRIPHLKSPDKPDAVLHFLRQAGVTEPHIRAAALRDPSFLCFSVDKCLKPRIAELQEIAFSPSHISLLLSINPTSLAYTKLQQTVQFWLGILNSVDKLLGVLKNNFFLLAASPKTSSANLSFLQEQCNLSVPQIARFVVWAPRSITFSPEKLKINVKRAEELGVSRSSGMFIHALRVVTNLNPSTIDARLHHLRSLGLTQVEVTNLVSKQPLVLTMPEEMIGRKMEFLVTQAGCDKLYVVQNPVLLSLSLEKRLVPRCLVRRLLDSKGLLVGKKGLFSFMQPSEEVFLEKFVLPYEQTVPGIHQAYIDACAGKAEIV